MKLLFFLCLCFLAGCGGNEDTKVTLTPPKTIQDTVVDSISKPPLYESDRFRNVMVRHLTTGMFQVSGEARTFEAAFGWVVEDGHYELKNGHGMTDAGAPAWGHFTLSLKLQPNQITLSTHLILFESSAKDGSRQGELIIPLVPITD